MKRLRSFKHCWLGSFLSISLLSACQVPPTDSSPGQADTVMVVAGGEQLRGQRSLQHPHISAFLGVPFAAPPIGDLRWRAPQAAQARIGTQDAATYAAACYQNGGGVDWYRELATAFGQPTDVVEEPVAISEDCLYLNIWTPADLSTSPRSKRLPVLVWIHGGGNTGGWAYEPNYVGESLAKKGVVVVSIAYRLGVFGFFSHPGMDQDQQPYTANFGLLDQIKGLEWVKTNIRAFGGDPSKVTVAGESAGSANVGYMLASPLARDLFKRSIHQSGSFELIDFNTKETVQAAVHTLDPVADSSHSEHLAALRALDAATLLSMADEKYNGDLYYPVVDQQVLPTTVYDYYRNQKNSPRDMLVGSTGDEWLMYLDPPESTKEIDNWLDTNLPGVEKTAVYQQLLDHPSLHKKLELLVTANIMRCPGYYLAEKNAQQGGQSWVYQFDRIRRGKGGELLGAYHGAELPYMFDTHDSWLPTDDIDRALTSAMVDYWINFVKTGNPNDKTLARWPAYTSDAKQVVLLDETIIPVDAPHASLCRWLGPKH